MLTNNFLLSIIYVMFSDVLFIFLCFSIGSIVSNSFILSSCNQNDFSFFSFTHYTIFNGILKLVFNLRNNCLYSIINFLSNLKITSKQILIFNYFLHMSDFGHGCELLKKIELCFSRWLVLI